MQMQGKGTDPLKKSVTTLKSVKRRLGLAVPMICHPVCLNSECHQVVYSFVIMDVEVKGLVPVCPTCETQLRSEGKAGEAVVCKWFNRIPLKYEMERIMAYPGVEAECFD
jgi:hypothetical protein